MSICKKKYLSTCQSRKQYHGGQLYSQCPKAQRSKFSTLRIQLCEDFFTQRFFLVFRITTARECSNYSQVSIVQLLICSISVPHYLENGTRKTSEKKSKSNLLFNLTHILFWKPWLCCRSNKIASDIILPDPVI